MCGLFVEKGSELGQQSAGDDFGALGGGVYPVLLDGAGDVYEVLVDHGDEGDVVFRSEVAEDIVEGRDVVGTVIKGQRDACQQDFDVGGFKSG